MTSEQIAELRKLDTLPPGPERRLAVYEAAVNFMPRLLDEREALLEAARHVVDAASSGRGPMTAGELRLQAVVAKAEAP